MSIACVRKTKRGEIKLKAPLQIHMENKSADGGLTNINSAKEYTLKIKVDTTELDEAIKKLKKMNKLVEKIKAHQIV